MLFPFSSIILPLEFKIYERIKNMLAFFLAPFYLLVNFYVLRWVLRFIETCFSHFQINWLKWGFSTLYIFICLSPLIAFLLPSTPVQKWIAKLSNYWFGTFLYILLTIVVLDLLHIIIKHSSFLMQRLPDPQKIFLFVGSFCIIFVIGITLYGAHCARNIRTTSYHINIASETMNNESLKVVLIADLHLGQSIGHHHVEKMVKKINQVQPDLVCIAGDIFDNDFEALDSPEKITSALRNIQSTYGVYACYGNHDYEEAILAGFTFSSDENVYIGKKMEALLADANIKTLTDESVLINNQFYLIGRKDYSAKSKSNEVRLTPEELTEGLDQNKPILVMDHQPKELEELAAAGVDLDLCGHTHDGQIFPGNIITRLMWENSYGHLQKGKMHNIVTSGVGIFGPYMRIGTKSEIVEIQVDFH